MADRLAEIEALVQALRDAERSPDSMGRNLDIARANVQAHAPTALHDLLPVVKAAKELRDAQDACTDSGPAVLAVMNAEARLRAALANLEEPR